MPNDDDPMDRPIAVKFTPGTADYDLIKEVRRHLPGIKPARIVRILMRTGYLSFERSRRNEGMQNG